MYRIIHSFAGQTHLDQYALVRRFCAEFGLKCRKLSTPLVYEVDFRNQKCYNTIDVMFTKNSYVFWEFVSKNMYKMLVRVSYFTDHG